jgi:glycosyltransferase involved in cell wall biosynthesis
MAPAVVLYVVCDSDLYGTQRNILSSARRLDPDRHKPLVASPARGRFVDALRHERIPHFPLPLANLRDTSSVAALRNIIATENVSLVHAHLGISAFLSLAAARLSGNLPVVVTRHFIEDRYATISNPALKRLYAGIYARMNKRFARVIFVSEAVRSAIEAREGALGARGVVIPNGIDILRGPFKEELLPEDSERIRDRFGVPPGRFLVTTLSRLAPEKGLDTLLEAASALERARPGRFHFVVAGEGPLRAALLSAAASLNVSASVSLAGYVENSGELLAASDAFALCSRAEPFGIALLEAMASGLPCVAAGAGGPLEIISNNDSGLFFVPGDSQGLAALLLDIESDSSLRERLVRGARARVVNFDERSLSACLTAVYDDAVSRNPLK